MVEYNWTAFYLICLLIGVSFLFALILVVGNSSEIILTPEKVQQVIPAVERFLV